MCEDHWEGSKLPVRLCEHDEDGGEDGGLESFIFFFQKMPRTAGLGLAWR